MLSTDRAPHCPSCRCESGHRLPTSLRAPAVPAPVRSLAWARILARETALLDDCAHEAPKILLDGSRSFCGQCCRQLRENCLAAEAREGLVAQ